MENFFLPDGAISMQDVLITLAAFLAGWTKFAQRQKDQQLKSRDETIEFLKQQITYLQSQLHKEQK